MLRQGRKAREDQDQVRDPTRGVRILADRILADPTRAGPTAALPVATRAEHCLGPVIGTKATSTRAAIPPWGKPASSGTKDTSLPPWPPATRWSLRRWKPMNVR